MVNRFVLFLLVSVELIFCVCVLRLDFNRIDCIFNFLK